MQVMKAPGRTMDAQAVEWLDAVKWQADGLVPAPAKLCAADLCQTPAYARWEMLKMFPSLSRNQAAFPQDAVAMPFSVFRPGKS